MVALSGYRRLAALVFGTILLITVTGIAVAGPLEYADISTIRPLAEKGDADSQEFLGAAYAIGYGVPQDYAMAVTWYRKAAEQGKIGAQFTLAEMYYQGKVVPQDYASAA